jgi:predicted kinase
LSQAPKYLIAGYGLPGAGKTTFLSRLSQDHHLFYWRGDDARRHIFDHPTHQAHEDIILSRASTYAFEEALRQGSSCVYDVNTNSRSSRRRLAELAHHYDAEFWLIWVQTPEELAVQRVQARAAQAPAQWQEYYQMLPEHLVERMKMQMEPPGPDDKVIMIDGRAPYAEQLKLVRDHLEF